MGKTKFIVFHLTNTDQNDEFVLDRDGIIRQIAMHADTQGDIVNAVRFFLDELQIFPEGTKADSGNEDHFTVAYDGWELECWESVRKGQVLEINSVCAAGEELHAVITILPVDVLTTKLHRESIQELARVMKSG